MRTFDEPAYYHECDDHAAHSNERLYPSTQNVEHEASKNSYGKGPAVYYNLNLGLSLRTGDTGLSENFAEIVSMTWRLET